MPGGAVFCHSLPNCHSSPAGIMSSDVTSLGYTRSTNNNKTTDADTTEMAERDELDNSRDGKRKDPGVIAREMDLLAPRLQEVSLEDKRAGYITREMDQLTPQLQGVSLSPNNGQPAQQQQNPSTQQQNPPPSRRQKTPPWRQQHNRHAQYSHSVQNPPLWRQQHNQHPQESHSVQKLPPWRQPRNQRAQYTHSVQNRMQVQQSQPQWPAYGAAHQQPQGYTHGKWQGFGNPRANQQQVQDQWLSPANAQEYQPHPCGQSQGHGTAQYQQQQAPNQWPGYSVQNQYTQWPPALGQYVHPPQQGYDAQQHNHPVHPATAYPVADHAALPGGGVALPTVQHPAPGQTPVLNTPQGFSNVPNHPSGWTPINEHHGGFASGLLNPSLSSPPSGAFRGMHTGKKLSRAKLPYNRDAKVYTGPAPEPTKEYLDQAALEPHRNYAPTRPQHLLILDLNGTLVHRPDRRHLNKIIPRPYLAPFLEFIFANFDVMVWSSARPDNVNLMINKVLGNTYTPQLRAVWNRNNFGLSKEHYSQNVQVYKQLTRIWNSEELSGCMYDQATTILLDDTALKAAAEPFNLVEIPEFTAAKDQMESDVLREVAGYLEELRYQMDVSTFIKRHPFKADGTWQMKWSDELAGGGVKLDG
ncbi:hypothetical protein BU16DRAFT_621378 [Lophium mytilinum]|uniref:FCP1 homology domain-containing protein n=1 Tax=Lophium mytilinum TaxID=390894 RepID=A0A6A6QIK6_9PEZI|nr:hypothetical protein BU16DRAFT_621378 [Lophium mytilinum]